MLASFCFSSLFFFFNDTATTEIYTLSLHDALPISGHDDRRPVRAWCGGRPPTKGVLHLSCEDRKSTRLNSSHGYISYAVFCLKKKKKRNFTIAPVILAKNVPTTDTVQVAFRQGFIT